MKKSDDIKGKRCEELLDLGTDSIFAIDKVVYNHPALIKSKGSRCLLDIYPSHYDNDKSRYIIVIRDIADIRKLVYDFSILPGMRTFGEIVYRSKIMHELLEKARRVASSNTNVLIFGESGTGKELLAKAMHMASPRQDYPFVAINCAALPEDLLESELFGYEEGAFTGSRRGGKEGLFEFANNGTLFLDEIGDMPLNTQAKLLRVLQEQKIRRIGGLREYKINVVIFSATNKDLRELILKGEFRADLYYRLNTVPLTLPPLRHRKEDIPVLVHYFIKKICQKLNRPVISFDNSFLNKLKEYAWPGNVREMENVLERSIILAKANELTARDLILDEDTMSGSNLTPIIEQFEKRITHFVSSGEPSSLKDFMQSIEKDVLSYICTHYKSSRQLGSKLGLSNTAVINKLKKYGVGPYKE